MKASLNWVRYLNDKYHCAAEPAPKSIDDLVEHIGLKLGAVDEVIDLGKKYQGIIIAKVKSCEKHPNADKLSVCMIDTGKGQPIQVVCGAPNVKAGMLAAWIPPGETVPSTYDKEPFVLEAREIRGFVSNGMLASAKELDLGDDHTGIVEVDSGKPGDDFAKTYRLDDYIIDIENKMFTHRPDCFGQLGVAREIAGIQGHKFTSPNWYREKVEIEKSRARDDRQLSFKNNVPKLVPRFTLAVIKDVKIKPSPLFVAARLASIGVRPINNIVDLTNFIMLETAQPLHAYDYDKVLALQKDKKNGVKMGVRLSKKGEELKLLGSKQIKLEEEALVITADDKPIGLGGVMGGADTEVDVNTKSIILECANFDMNATRRTAMNYGLFTDAATRFTKGQNPRQNMAVLARAADDIIKAAGGRISSIIDDKHYESSGKTLNTSVKFIEDRLGEKLGPAKIKQLLENVEISVAASGERLKITPPFWRTDIEIPEDVVEEVGRLYGYEHLPQKLPIKDLSPAQSNGLLAIKVKIREILSAAGANEVLTYSFVHGSLLEKAGQDIKKAYKIVNALSPDLQYYRPGLTPSLLDKVHPNIKSGVDLFVLFELGIGHILGDFDNEKLPREIQRLSLVVAAKQPLAGAPYYLAKRYAEYLLEKLGIFGITYESIVASRSDEPVTIFEPGRSADVYVGKQSVGCIGEFKQAVIDGFKLPSYCAGFELDTDVLLNLAAASQYKPLNKFPSLDQDITLKLPNETAYSKATDFIYDFLEAASNEHGYKGSLRPVDIYQNKSDIRHKHISWRIVLSHPERTLTTAETNKLLDELSALAGKKLNATRV